jgi:hypothetical protein
MIGKQVLARLRQRWRRSEIIEPERVRSVAAFRSRRLLGTTALVGVAALLVQQAKAAAPVVGFSANRATFDITLSGCAGDGTTDDQPKIQAWLTALSTQYPGGCEITLASGKFYLIGAATLTIPKHFIVRGTYNAQDNQTANGTFFGGGGFLVDPTLPAGIILSACSSLKNCKVYRSGLIASASAAQVATAQAAWAAEALYAQTNGAMALHDTLIPLSSTTGITVGMPVTGPGGIGPGGTVATVSSINPGVSATMTGAGVNAIVASGAWFRFGGSIGIQIPYNNSANVIDGVEVIGFRTGIQAFPGQFWIEHVHADCITCFEDCNGGDTASIMNCEFMPLYGIATGNAPRPGDSVFYHDGGVTTTLYNVFSIGWLVGFHFTNVQGTVAVNCGNESFDGAGTVNWLLDNCSQVRLHDCYATSGATGFHVLNTSAFYLSGCVSAGGPSSAGDNVAHFWIEGPAKNIYGALVAPVTLAKYPDKIPIKLGTINGACSIVHPVIDGVVVNPLTAPLIQGTMPNAQTPEFKQGIPLQNVGSGATLTMLSYWNGANIYGTTTLATLTIVLNPFPFDGQVLEFWFNREVTALTVSTSDGSSVGKYPNPGPGSHQKWIYNAAQNTWYCGGSQRALNAATQATPSNPTGATTGAMMGLAGTVTPVNTGRVAITVSGDCFNAGAIADGVTIAIRTGTGSAPANAAALTGTIRGTTLNYVTATTAEKAPFSLSALVTGLTIGTAVWIDLGVANITGGTATVENITIVAVEV